MSFCGERHTLLAAYNKHNEKERGNPHPFSLIYRALNSLEQESRVFA